jgi:hypothetical protein
MPGAFEVSEGQVVLDVGQDAAPGGELSKGAGAATAFAVFASVGYFLSIGFNAAPFIYYPEVGEFHLTVQPETLGPPMFWYGWIVYGFIAGAIGAAIVHLLPRPLAATLAGRLSWLAWAVPTAVILATLYLLRSFFQ